MNSFLKPLYEVFRWEGLEGSTIKRLYNNIILNTRIIIPSVQEQVQIGEFFAALNRLIAARQRQVKKYQMIKQGMMEELLSGRTRLSEGDDVQ